MTLNRSFKNRRLGHSGLDVSRLCYGTLTLSPGQAGYTSAEGADLLLHAFNQGVTFWDTAEIYDTYPHIHAALKRLTTSPVIATKTYAWDRASAEASLDKARHAMDLDVIDIFLLHEQESVLTMDGHREAFEYLLDQKHNGRIRAVGMSTHAVEPVLALASAVSGQHTPAVWQGIDPGVYREADIVHPLLNLKGIGLLDGTSSDMIEAVRLAHEAGIGVYGMKMLGGGHLLNHFDEAVDFALGLDAADAYAVGMQSRAEIDMNVALFSGRPVSQEMLDKTRAKKRRLAIGDWCTGCGACVKRCGEHALRLENGKVRVDPDRCIFCGYCATVCRDFVIKVV